MAKAKFPIVILPGFAAALAVGAGLVHAASVEPRLAYGAPASQLEATTIVETARTVFSRADLDNDRDLSREEYVTLAVVTAELARLNGFVTVDYAGGVRTAQLPRVHAWTSNERAGVEASASRDYGFFAGDDDRMSGEEFVAARLEALSLADTDRNGVLRGAELTRFAAIEARLVGRQS
jgi:hypothetical protein